MPTSHAPQKLDVLAFARTEGALAGNGGLQHFPRLLEQGTASSTATPSAITWHANGAWRQVAGGAGAAWLHLQAQAELPTICQRCLGPMLLPLAVDRWFRFVADEATADAEDEQAEEDLLVASREFDLHALLEDELLMALPVVPRHAVCPVDVPLSATDPDFEAAEQRPNPFAALQGLKKG